MFINYNVTERAPNAYTHIYVIDIAYTTLRYKYGQPVKPATFYTK